MQTLGLTRVACPDCRQGEIMEALGRGRIFYVCGRYPECKFAIWDKPIPERCPQCKAPFVVEKLTKDKGTVRRCLTEDCKYQETGREHQAQVESCASQSPSRSGERRMDSSQFWKIIDSSRRAANGRAAEQLETLREQLAALASDEVIEFDRILSEYHARAYTWNLWGAAYVIGGGCSDDGFMDFRGWLISRGEDTYEAALANADSLADVVTASDRSCQVEGFQYVARKVWEQKTRMASSNFPRHKIEQRKGPEGEPWQGDDVEKRFPRLAKKFG